MNGIISVLREVLETIGSPEYAKDEDLQIAWVKLNIAIEGLEHKQKSYNRITEAMNEILNSEDGAYRP